MFISFIRKGLCLAGSWLAVVSALMAQQADTVSVRHLSEVEVTEKARSSVTRQGAPFQLMNKGDIERLGLEDLSEAVKRFSGVSVKDYGGIGGLKTVSVRSLGAQHTAVSYDGVTVTDAQSGQVDISRFSLDNVEALSLSIGQSDNIFQSARMFASAGALQIQTLRPDFTDKNFHIRGRLKGGSFGLFNPTVRYEQKISPVWSTTAHAEWLSAKGEYPFTLTNGQVVTEEKRMNSDIQSMRLEGNIFGDFSTAGKLRVKLYYFDSERGLPGSVILYNNYARERLWDNNFFIQAHYETHFHDKLAFQAQTKYNYSYGKYRDINDKYSSGKQEDRNTQDEYYGSAGILYTPFPYLSASLTSDLAYSSLVNNYVNGPMPTRWASLSVAAVQFKNSRITGTASLLGTYMTDKVKSGDKPADKKRLSPAVSLSVRPFAESTFRVRASYQNTFRVPTFTDLYYLRMGNTNLRPEKATQYNAGLTWSGRIGQVVRHLNISADAYYNKVSDKIVALPTLYIWKMMNMGEVDIKGADINLSAEFALYKEIGLLFTSTYSYQKAIDLTDENNKTYRHQIPYTPKHSGTASLTLENPWVNISYNLTAVDKRYALPQNIESNLIEGYVEQGISLNKEFPVQSCTLRVQGEILNLGDKTYDIVQYYPMPGRSWRLSLTIIY